MTCEVRDPDGSVRVFPGTCQCNGGIASVQLWMAAHPVKVQLIIGALINAFPALNWLQVLA